MTNPKSPTDQQILALLEQDIADGKINEANLVHWREPDKGTDRIGAMILSVLSFLARNVPQTLGYSLFSGGVSALVSLIPQIRSDVESRLALAFPNAQPKPLKTKRRAFCRQLGMTLFELLDHDRFMPGLLNRLTVDGTEHVKAAQVAKQPIIFVHAHQANWEIMLDACEAITDSALCALYSPLAIPSIQRRQLYRRTRRGSRFYPRSFRLAPGKVLKDLKLGYPFIVALDQRAGKTRVPFFNRPARTTLIPLKLAQRVGAHILPLDLRRKGPKGHFHLTIHENIAPKNITEQWDLRRILGQYNELLETWIEDRPEDWFWLHDRWS